MKDSIPFHGVGGFAAAILDPAFVPSVTHNPREDRDWWFGIQQS